MAHPPTPDFNVGSELEFEEYAPQLRLLRPRMRPDVEPVPQRFRDKTWFVLQDPVTLQFYRLGETEREVLGQLDGQHALGEIHDRLKAKFGPEAPSFREVAQFVMMLRQANLTVPEAGEENRWNIERKAKKRRQKVKQYLANFMYLTIPLLDPERALAAAMPYLRWIFTWPTLAGWTAVVGAALFAFAFHFREFVEPANGILAPDNLLFLYVAFVLTKACHEFGHAVAAKAYGAEVHRMGVMFLIFMPTPYVDVTSVWAFPQKGPKVLVGAAGMMTELLIAALAVFGWLSLEPGALRTILYNMIFVASVSSILFNGNPLLRYDAYYILADLIEIPNLRQRSNQFMTQWLRRQVIGEKIPPPEGTPRERAWYLGYGILSLIYRTIIVVGIILYIASKLFFLGLAMAAVVAALWIITPLVKLMRYLFYDSGTRPVRWRAAGVFGGVLLALGLSFGVLPVSNGVRVPCVIEPVERFVLRAEWPGFISEVRAHDGQHVRQGDVIVVMRNEELEYQVRRMAARIEESAARLRMLQTRDLAAAQAEEFNLAMLKKDYETLKSRLDSLTFRAPFDGEVIAPGLEHVGGRFAQLGEEVCQVASLDRLRVVAVVDTGDVAGIAKSQARDVRIKFRSHPHAVLRGRVERLHPSATYAAPLAPLTTTAGGPILLDPNSPQGQHTLLPWYRVDVTLQAAAETPPVGVVGTARFVVNDEPLGQQVWTGFRRMLHRRFLI